jgi:hypothetical protein
MKITPEAALPIVRSVEEKLIPLGAHCSLGGSVLHRGESTKDLDIFVYPHNQDKPKTPEDLIAALKSIFPEGYDATDNNYPHDRLRFVVIQKTAEGFLKLEFFVFLTVQPAT